MGKLSQEIIVKPIDIKYNNGIMIKPELTLSQKVHQFVESAEAAGQGYCATAQTGQQSLTPGHISRHVKFRHQRIGPTAVNHKLRNDAYGLSAA